MSSAIRVSANMGSHLEWEGPCRPGVKSNLHALQNALIPQNNQIRHCLEPCRAAAFPSELFNLVLFEKLEMSTT